MKDDAIIGLIEDDLRAMASEIDAEHADDLAEAFVKLFEHELRIRGSPRAHYTDTYHEIIDAIGSEEE